MQTPGESKRDHTKPLLSAIAIALFGAAIGFGISQATLATTVQIHGTEISHLKLADSGLRSDLDAVRRASDVHMREVIDLLKEHLKVNQEFINLLKVQHEIMSRKP